MWTVSVRQGRKADAKEAVDVLRRSISELCVQDHHNDPATVAEWLANKTEQAWNDWVAQRDTAVFVAISHNQIVGLGMASARGEVLLNYVKPDARFSGVSKAILRALEGYVSDQGKDHCFLESTIAARTFYESCGYKRQPGDELHLCKRLDPLV